MKILFAIVLVSLSGCVSYPRSNVRNYHHRHHRHHSVEQIYLYQIT